MKKLLNQISSKLFNKTSNFKIIEKLKEWFEILLDYSLPENWKESRKSYILFWLIGAFTVSFMIWASVAEINQVVRAAGTVTPDSKIHVVQTALGGPIEDLKLV